MKFLAIFLLFLQILQAIQIFDTPNCISQNSKIKAYNAIVIATDLNISNLTKLELKKILSTKIQNRGDFIENPYKILSQINKNFPQIPIKIYSDLDEKNLKVLSDFIGDLKAFEKPNFSDKEGIFILSFSQFYNKTNGLKLANINGISPTKQNIKTKKYPLFYTIFLDENNQDICEILGVIR